jgi:methionyl-tRNA synthetase
MFVVPVKWGMGHFLISNGPEKRDTDFTWREFINSHNGELLGAYGNFVNRSLVFIHL